MGHAGQTAWADDLAAENVSAERVRRLPLHGLLVDDPVATALRRVLVPKVLRTRIRESRQMRDRPTIPEAALPALKARFLKDRAILLVLHDLTVAANYADYVVGLKAGKLHCAGAWNEVATSELLSDLYDVPLKMTQIDGQRAVIWAQ